MELLEQISAAMQSGKRKDVETLVTQALEEGISADDILKNGLLAGMSVVGEKFKANEIFVPHVLVAARAMKAGTEILQPHLSGDAASGIGKACIGTVKGDLHDIGKNLVVMMLRGKGFEVIDLGVDVDTETFVKTALDENCDIIACSALLTTTMPVMEEVVQAVTEAGLRDKVTIMVGGAPVTQDFADKIGADIYADDAATSAELAAALFSDK